jgi:GNAT superfamily N-acetyltransferase
VRDGTRPGEHVRVHTTLDLRPTRFDHPDALRLIAELQEVYRQRYGDGDTTPVDTSEFAPPRGHFVIGYCGDGDGDGAGDEAVACGGWRARDGGDPALRPGDAEIKRMYVRDAHRGRGFARAVLSELERTAAAAGRLRVVLESGTAQPEAIALYTSSGYHRIPGFGTYRDWPDSRCFAKALAPIGRPAQAGPAGR